MPCKQWPVLFPPPERHRGLSLIELMVVVAIVALLATLAAPSFRKQIAASRLTGGSGDLMTTFMQARSHAIQTGSRVAVCRSSNQNDCDTDAAGRWDSGWIAFLDSDANNTRDGSEAIILSASALSSELLARGNQPVRNVIAFRPSGQASASGTLRVCSTSTALDDTQRTHDLILINNGRVVLRRTAGVDSQCPAP